MNNEILDRLQLLDYKIDRKLYLKINHRQKAGTMTTYIWNKRIYYDTEEYSEKIKTGRRNKIIEFERKPIINVNEWLNRNNI